MVHILARISDQHILAGVAFDAVCVAELEFRVAGGECMDDSHGRTPCGIEGDGDTRSVGIDVRILGIPLGSPMNVTPIVPVVAAEAHLVPIKHSSILRGQRTLKMPLGNILGPVVVRCEFTNFVCGVESRGACAFQFLWHWQDHVEGERAAAVRCRNAAVMQEILARRCGAGHDETI